LNPLFFLNQTPQKKNTETVEELEKEKSEEIKTDDDEKKKAESFEKKKAARQRRFEMERKLTETKQHGDESCVADQEQISMEVEEEGGQQQEEEKGEESNNLLIQEGDVDDFSSYRQVDPSSEIYEAQDRVPTITIQEKEEIFIDENHQGEDIDVPQGEIVSEEIERQEEIQEEMQEEGQEEIPKETQEEVQEEGQEEEEGGPNESEVVVGNGEEDFGPTEEIDDIQNEAIGRSVVTVEIPDDQEEEIPEQEQEGDEEGNEG